MAHAHHDSGTTVVTDREGMSGVVMGILAAVLVVFLIWLFAFSGVVFDRGSGGQGGTTNIEQNVEGDSGGTGTTESTSPAPTSS